MLEVSTVLGLPMSLFFVLFFLFYIILNSLLYPLIAQNFDYCQLFLINFMCYIIDSVNLVVIVSNRSCFYLFYGSCQGYLVCFITLYVFCFVFGSFFIIGSYFSSFHVSFRDILIDTS